MSNGEAQSDDVVRAALLKARKRYEEAVAERQRIADAKDVASDAETAQGAAHALRLAYEAEEDALRQYQHVVQMAIGLEGPLGGE
jgi:hypothetical protein